jgi:SOS-response transcriptional repressor LexA
MRYPALARQVELLLTRERLTRREAAAKAGLSYEVVWKMGTGESVADDTLRKFARAFNEDETDWLLLVHPDLAEAIEKRLARQADEVRDGYSPRPSDAALPVAGTARAATVSMPEEQTGEYFWATAEHARAADFVLRVEGYSLYPYVLPGDYVAIKKGAVPEVGDIVLARLDDTLYLKRYQGLRGRRVVLTSDNPEHGPVESEAIDIIGVCAWQHRPAAVARRTR